MAGQFKNYPEIPKIVGAALVAAHLRARHAVPLRLNPFRAGASPALAVLKMDNSCLVLMIKTFGQGRNTKPS